MSHALSRFLSIAFLLIAVSHFASAQSAFIEDENRIGSAIDGFVRSHRLRIGFLRIQPSLSLNAGFDSNALYSEDETSDFFFSVAPGASVGVKLGSRAFFKVLEQVNFLYYLKTEERRDIYTSTRLQFVTGTPDVLITIDGDYEKQKAVVDEEIDVPVSHQFSFVGITASYAATNKIEMRHGLNVSVTRFLGDEELPETFPELRDAFGVILNTEADYQLKSNLNLTLDGEFGRAETLDTDQDSTFWGVQSGFDITKRRYRADFSIGYGQSHSQGNTQGSLIMAAGIDLITTRNFGLGVDVSRQHEISFIADDVARLVTTIGIHTNIPLFQKLSVGASLIIGFNDYGDSTVSGQPVEKDRFTNGDAHLSYTLFRALSLRAGVNYLKRDTDIPDLNKERTAYYFGLSAGYQLTY